VYVATEGPLGWSAVKAANRLGIPVATGFHARFDSYARSYGLGSLSSLARRDPRLRARWAVPRHGLAVIHVGRIAAEKNLELAVHAFRRIREHRSDARFVWVGEGPQAARLQRENPDFIFAGLRLGEDLAMQFASADLFLFPSLTETFGNVTLEAMASGVPTVAFDYGAARRGTREAARAATVVQRPEQVARDFVGLLAGLPARAVA
jgi:glycosyltransferase involved in cell wall biosynthesis